MHENQKWNNLISFSSVEQRGQQCLVGICLYFSYLLRKDIMNSSHQPAEPRYSKYTACADEFQKPHFHKESYLLLYKHRYLRKIRLLYKYKTELEEKQGKEAVSQGWYFIKIWAWQRNVQVINTWWDVFVHGKVDCF